MGDGTNFFIWHDNWHPKGPLLLKFGHIVIYDSASSVDAKHASVIQDGNWNWGYARSENLVAILSKLPLIEFVDIDKA